MELAVAFIAALGTIIVTLLSLWGAKKFKIGENQEKLVATLKDIVSAQEIKIDQLEAQAAENSLRIENLERDISALQALTVRQALIISKLESKLSMRGGE